MVLAYPHVLIPTAYISLWFANFFGILVNLLLVTDAWVHVRLYLKYFLIYLFKCNPYCCPPGREWDMTEKLDDRGHSNNYSGYFRRQVRFYFWRCLSVIAAGIFYVALSTILRFQFNQAFFPFIGMTPQEYINSIIFSFIIITLTFLALGVGYLILKY